MCLYAQHALSNLTALVQNEQQRREDTFTPPTVELGARAPSWGRYSKEVAEKIGSKVGRVVSVEQAPRGWVRANYRQPASPKTSSVAAELSEREADRMGGSRTKPK